MANRQLKKEKQQPPDTKADAEIIHAFIENRKYQRDALIKIMASMDLAGEVNPPLVKPAENATDTAAEITRKNRIKK